MVPPDTGMAHQVNLEYLSRVVFTWQDPDEPMAYPDTLVRTDAHSSERGRRPSRNHRRDFAVVHRAGSATAMARRAMTRW